MNRRPLAAVLILSAAVTLAGCESARVRVLVAENTLRAGQDAFRANLRHMDDPVAIRAARDGFNAARSAVARSYQATTRPVRTGPDGTPVDVLDDTLDVMEQVVAAAMNTWKQIKDTR